MDAARWLVCLAVALGASGATADGPVRYRIETRSAGAGALDVRFPAERIDLLEKLNRRDRRHLARADRVLVPERWDLDERAYAPLPQTWEWAEGFPKALVVHQPGQVFGGYERGRLVRWGPVSSGSARHPTPPGFYNLNWRSPGRHSSVNPDWYMPWYFNFEARRGLSLHEYVLPGRPASHACVRLLARDARWLYAWGEGRRIDASGAVVAGTPFLILGTYDHDAPPPWLEPGWTIEALPDVVVVDAPEAWP